MPHPKPRIHAILHPFFLTLALSIPLAAQGFSTLTVDAVVWKSESTPLQGISLDNTVTNTISGDATGTLVFDLTGFSSVIDSSGVYQDPGIAFACRLQLPGGGASKYVQLENGVTVGFAEIWHAGNEDVTTLSFDPITGAGKYRIACPLDSDLDHLEFSTSSTELQTMDFWIGFAGQIGDDGLAPPSSFSLSSLIKTIVTPPALQIFQPEGAATLGVPTESPSRVMVIVGTQSSQTRSLNVSASIPDYSGDPVSDGNVGITPSTIPVAPGQSVAFFDITIHDDGLLFPNQRVLTLTLDLDGNDVTTTKLQVATASFRDTLVDATGEGVWASNRTCVYGTSGGGANFPPPLLPVKNAMKSRRITMGIPSIHLRQSGCHHSPISVLDTRPSPAKRAFSIDAISSKIDLRFLSSR